MKWKIYESRWRIFYRCHTRSHLEIWCHWSIIIFFMQWTLFYIFFFSLWSDIIWCLGDIQSTFHQFVISISSWLPILRTLDMKGQTFVFDLSFSEFLTQLSHNFSTLKVFKHTSLSPHSLLLTSLIMILGLCLDLDTQRHTFQIYDLHIINAYKLFWGDSSEQLMLIILHVTGFF